MFGNKTSDGKLNPSHKSLTPAGEIVVHWPRQLFRHRVLLLTIDAYSPTWLLAHPFLVTPFPNAVVMNPHAILSRLTSRASIKVSYASHVVS